MGYNGSVFNRLEDFAMQKLAASLILMLAASLPAAAQSPDEAAVARAVDSLSKAMIAADKAALDNLTADELTYGHSSPKLDTKASFIDSLMTRKSAFKTVDLTKQTVQVVGDLAIVRAHFSSDIEPEGKPGHVELEVLMIWQKRNGGWKLLARQAYKL
jgi:ketosteroid isomerase-like protein